MKLCKDQLIGKLVDLFAEVDPDNIDDAVVQANGQLAQKTKQARRSDLERLFDTQIATLKDRSVSAPIVEMFRNQRSAVLARASEMAFENGRVPFLPVIPKVYRSIYDQMSMVKNGDKVGYTDLEPTNTTDVVETPTKPYYIYDVEDGEVMRGKAPRDAEKLIKKQNGRRGLTEVEVIALGVHTDVLSRHYVDAVVSRYDSVGVPGLCLDGGWPRLSWFSLGGGNGRWGAASCGSR